TIDKDYPKTKAGYSFEVGEPAVRRILSRLRPSRSIITKIETVCRKDSQDVTDEDRSELLEKVTGATQSRLVVTHGTDTLIKTATFLANGLRDRGVTAKTVVFTGSFSPEKFRDTDADFNRQPLKASVPSLSLPVPPSPVLPSPLSPPPTYTPLPRAHLSPLFPAPYPVFSPLPSPMPSPPLSLPHPSALPSPTYSPLPCHPLPVHSLSPILCPPPPTYSLSHATPSPVTPLSPVPLPPPLSPPTPRTQAHPDAGIELLLEETHVPISL
ncbi:hypothetical protein C7M84_005076, partial [Penaeus vannamei]